MSRTFNIFAGTSMSIFTTTVLVQQFSNCYIDDLEREYKKKYKKDGIIKSQKLSKIEDWRNKDFLEQMKEFPRIIKN